ncbi:hypothetical protein L7F22_008618 [Adiantum nelumboides]|nr:hypothetical protein [Adiantum nelumboides]
MIRVDGTGKFELDYEAMDEEAGQEEGWFDAAQFEENMSTHYGRMVHLDDKTIMFANPEDAAEYIDFDLKPVLKEAAVKTNDIVGDGTTTATVIAQAIVREGMNAIQPGGNPVLVKRGIDIAVNALVDRLQTVSHPVSTRRTTPAWPPSRPTTTTRSAGRREGAAHRGRRRRRHRRRHPAAGRLGGLRRGLRVRQRLRLAVHGDQPRHARGDRRRPLHPLHRAQDQGRPADHAGAGPDHAQRPAPARHRRGDRRGHRPADAGAQPRQRAPPGHRDPGARVRREAHPPAGGHGRAVRRAGALQELLVLARADRRRAPGARRAGAGHQRGHHDHRRARRQAEAGVPAVAAAGRAGPRDDRHRRGLLLRPHRPALREGRDHLGRGADQRRGPRDPPPRRRLAAGHPGRDGRGHRRRRRVGAAARRARARRAGRDRGLPDRRRDRPGRAHRAGAPHRHQRRLRRGRRGQAGHDHGRRRGLRRPGGPLRQHGRDGHHRPAAGRALRAAERRLGRRADPHHQLAGGRGGHALEQGAHDRVRPARRGHPAAQPGLEHAPVDGARPVGRWRGGRRGPVLRSAPGARWSPGGRRRPGARLGRTAAQPGGPGGGAVRRGPAAPPPDGRPVAAPAVRGRVRAGHAAGAGRARALRGGPRGARPGRLRGPVRARVRRTGLARRARRRAPRAARAGGGARPRRPGPRPRHRGPGRPRRSARADRAAGPSSGDRAVAAGAVAAPHPDPGRAGRRRGGPHRDRADRATVARGTGVGARGRRRRGRRRTAAPVAGVGRAGPRRVRAPGPGAQRRAAAGRCRRRHRGRRAGHGPAQDPVRGRRRLRPDRLAGPAGPPAQRLRAAHRPADRVAPAPGVRRRGARRAAGRLRPGPADVRQRLPAGAPGAPDPRPHDLPLPRRAARTVPRARRRRPRRPARRHRGAGPRERQPSQRVLSFRRTRKGNGHGTHPTADASHDAGCGRWRRTGRVRRGRQVGDRHRCRGGECRVPGDDRGQARCGDDPAGPAAGGVRGLHRPRRDPRARGGAGGGALLVRRREGRRAAVGPGGRAGVGAAPAVLNMSSVEPEKIAAQRPDLVIGLYSDLDAQSYPVVSAVAPTVGPPRGFDDYGAPWQEYTRETGRALGKEAEAEKLVADLEARFVAARDADPQWKGRSVVVASRSADKISVFSSQDPRSRFFTQLGFTVPPGSTSWPQAAFRPCSTRSSPSCSGRFRRPEPRRPTRRPPLRGAVWSGTTTPDGRGEQEQHRGRRAEGGGEPEGLGDRAEPARPQARAGVVGDVPGGAGGAVALRSGGGEQGDHRVVLHQPEPGADDGRPHHQQDRRVRRGEHPEQPDRGARRPDREQCPGTSAAVGEGARDAAAEQRAECGGEQRGGHRDGRPGGDERGEGDHAALRGGAAQHRQDRRGGEPPAGLAGVRDGVVAAGCRGPPGAPHERHHQGSGDRVIPASRNTPVNPSASTTATTCGQEQQLGQADGVAVARRRATVCGGLDQLRDERAPRDRRQPEPDPADRGDRQHGPEVGGQREQRRREAEQQRPHDQHRTVPDPAQHRGHQQLGGHGGRHQHAGAQPRTELAGAAPGHPTAARPAGAGRTRRTPARSRRGAGGTGATTASGARPTVSDTPSRRARSPRGGVLRRRWGGVAVSGADPGVGGQGQQGGPDRLDDRVEAGVGPSGGAGSALEQVVAGEDDAELGGVEAGRAREWPGVCSTVRSIPPAVRTCPSASSRSGLRSARSCPTGPSRRVEQDRRGEPVGQGRGLVDVVVVGVGAHDGLDAPVADGGGDGVGVVRGVDDEHLAVVADDPHVVVDVEGAAVEGEGAGGDDVVDRRHQRITTERRTSPACIFSKACSTPSIPISSVTNLSSGKRPCRNRSTYIGKVAAGQAVAVPGGLQRAAAAEDVDERDLRRLHVRGRDADQDDGAGEVAGVEGLLAGLGAPDGLDDDVGAVAVGHAPDELDRVGLLGVDGVGGAELAHSSFRGSVSTAMIVVAPASCAPAMAASPTPPQPMTAMESPRPIPPGVDRRAEAGHDAAAEQARDLRRARGVDLGALAGVDEGLLDERARSRGRGTARCRPRGSSSGWRCGCRSSTGLALLAGPALAADGAPVEDDEVAGRDVGDALADGLDDPGGLVAEQERELVVDAAAFVVQVGVADPAGLDLHHGLTGTGIGDIDRLDGDRLTLGAGHDATYLLCHCSYSTRPRCRPLGTDARMATLHG